MTEYWYEMPPCFDWAQWRIQYEETKMAHALVEVIAAMVDLLNETGEVQHFKIDPDVICPFCGEEAASPGKLHHHLYTRHPMPWSILKTGLRDVQRTQDQIVEIVERHKPV